VTECNACSPPHHLLGVAARPSASRFSLSWDPDLPPFAAHASFPGSFCLFPARPDTAFSPRSLMICPFPPRNHKTPNVAPRQSWCVFALTPIVLVFRSKFGPRLPVGLQPSLDHFRPNRGISTHPEERPGVHLPCRPMHGSAFHSSRSCSRVGIWHFFGGSRHICVRCRHLSGRATAVAPWRASLTPCISGQLCACRWYSALDILIGTEVDMNMNPFSKAFCYISVGT
jgi:hypothetical protein